MYFFHYQLKDLSDKLNHVFCIYFVPLFALMTAGMVLTKTHDHVPQHDLWIKIIVIPYCISYLF